MYYILYEELSHHGVKGMKWGVRKQQKAEARKKKRELKKKKAFDREYNRTWYQAYNNATHDFNSKLETVNKKYDGKELGDNFETKAGQKYVREVNNAWKISYTKALQNKYGNNLAKEYIDNAPMMNSYEKFIKK